MALLGAYPLMPASLWMGQHFVAASSNCLVLKKSQHVRFFEFFSNDHFEIAIEIRYLALAYFLCAKICRELSI